MGAVDSIDKLSTDAGPLPRLSNRTFQYIADTEFAPDLFHIDGLPLVREARIAGDHKEPLDPRQCGDDFVDHAVDEILLLKVAAHILEWQDCDRGFLGQRQRRVCRSARCWLATLGSFDE